MTSRAILLVPADGPIYHYALAVADSAVIGALCSLASDADGWRVCLTPPPGRRLCHRCELITDCRWDEVARVETTWTGWRVARGMAP